eukprot:Skav205070  [mRNA]  locus=scaffold142:421688:427329:+ [translate_table: standard]
MKRRGAGAIAAGKHRKARFILHAKKTAFIVEHDFIMATYLADRVIVYDGRPGIHCMASSPMSLLEGMNKIASKSPPAATSCWRNELLQQAGKIGDGVATCDLGLDGHDQMRVTMP